MRGSVSHPISILLRLGLNASLDIGGDVKKHDMKSMGRREYAVRARQAESQARKARDSFTREVWRQIADGYRRMAGNAASPAGDLEGG